MYVYFLAGAPLSLFHIKSQPCSYNCFDLPKQICLLALTIQRVPFFQRQNASEHIPCNCLFLERLHCLFIRLLFLSHPLEANMMLLHQLGIVFRLDTCAVKCCASALTSPWWPGVAGNHSSEWVRITRVYWDWFSHRCQIISHVKEADEEESKWRITVEGKQSEAEIVRKVDGDLESRCILREQKHPL